MPAFSISRSIQIDAPLDTVFTTVRDFRQWPRWSPWLITEPDCVVSYAEDGRSYAWEGDVVGCGRMKILEESPPSEIRYQLEFLKPWKSKADVGFQFRELDEGTEVTWTMKGSVPFFLFFMKKMMTAGMEMDYERGLSMLKDVIEKGSVPSTLEFEEKMKGAIDYVGFTKACKMEDIGPSMESAFNRMKAWFEGKNCGPSGPPFSIYHKWNMVKRETKYTVGFPVSEIPAEVPEDFVTGTLPEMKAFAIRHTGPYRYLGNAWAAGIMRVRARAFKQRRGIHPFEIYETEPVEGSDDEVVTVVTVVHFPMKEG